MVKPITTFLLTVYLACLFSGCASVLNSKRQKITLYTGTNDTKVYVDNELAGSGKVINTKLKRDFHIHQFRVEAKDYKPEYSVAVQTRKSPLHIMSWIPFGVLLFMPPLADHGPKSFSYEKEFDLKSKVRIATRGENQKYIYLKNTSFDVKKEDLTVELTDHKALKKNKKSKNITQGEEKIDISNSIFTDALNDILKKSGYVDTVNNVFKSKSNTLYVSAKVSKLKFRRATTKGTYWTFDTYWSAETTVEWSLLDIYEQVKYTQQIVSQSGDFVFSGKEESKNHITTTVEDALTNSFFQFLDAPSVKDLLQIDKNKKSNFTKLNLVSTHQPAQTLKNAQAATVTVVTKQGHGSGCTITEDGYILTNYHVVAGNKEVEIISNNGDKYKADVLRFNEDTDIALLQLKNFTGKMASFKLPLNRNFEVGDEVFAIGTPKSIELSQTLSKGIISGVRKAADFATLIQTDVSVNSGNSGGALINKQGELIGIVNSKMMGLGVEGISFCIPASDIAEKIGL